MENNQRNSRKRLNSLILLVAFTAVMLIVSTYAWFSSQKNVTLGGLTGEVRVAEGLEISLDAHYWSQEVNFGDYSTEQLKKIYASGKTLRDQTLTPADAEHNIVPTYMLPVSTTGREATGAATGDADGIGLTDMKMYRGININTNDLYEIIQVKQATDDADREDGRVFTAYGPNSETAVAAEHHDYPGYFAIDMFLRNSTTDVSTSDTPEGAAHNQYSKTNDLQLNANSKLELKSSSAEYTGLQNTVRVAFALYNMKEKYDTLSEVVWEDEDEEDKSWNNALSQDGFDASAYMTASQEQILKAYEGQTIKDVAIWEPNASDHVQTILDNYNGRYKATGRKYAATEGVLDYKGMSWDSADLGTYDIDDGASPTPVEGKLKLKQPLPTYALTYASTQLAKEDTDGTTGEGPKDKNTVQVGEGTTATFAKGITDIYDWDTPYSSLQKQVTLQTEMAGEGNYTVGKVKQLISVKSEAANRYTIGTESGAQKFVIPSGKVCKIRMYVWLEGQDVDTLNNASHGGGIKLDVGLLKDGTAQS